MAPRFGEEDSVHLNRLLAECAIPLESNSVAPFAMRSTKEEINSWQLL
jgi:hypothetical protein